MMFHRSGVQLTLFFYIHCSAVPEGTAPGGVEPACRAIAGPSEQLGCTAAEQGAGDEEVSALQTRQSIVESPAAEGGAEDAWLGPNFDFFDAADVNNALPLPPKQLNYPEPLRGMGWLDQSGFYAESTLAFAFPDLVISSGDTEYGTLDPETRTTKTSCAGKAWTWANTAQGYGWWGFSDVFDYHYVTTYNEDYTQFVTKPTAFVLFGYMSVPEWLVGLYGTKMPTPPDGACPPPPNATKQQATQCASSRRDTVLFPYLPFRVNLGTYHIFDIVDEKRNKIQPYFDVYLQYVANISRPDPAAARQYLGAHLGQVGGLKPQQLLVRKTGRPLPGTSFNGSPEGCQGLVGFKIGRLLQCLVALVKFITSGGFIRVTG
uniref:Phospholipase B-like n=1 Tax=Pyrodinium bahamense TaxID=73915 RepID=A0A7S0ARX5_9DINO|mmetsp:Transcript_41080/g.114178  ORF Transcript_41080/g.114178 Transcript_41080/m.114178 type:complete len:375 (+) Transcript_41080:65-1189(+)|eukprot:CAMPEP_0179077924 /NCGR_PEP_ID=MMETSP0796-20121207/34862_1 /TAXON_ID=73915 /ORGANISM="Pyrodinium bahamense, Strain pbaha01" /LENGTH=374 /DNA_ID=CAMNT_0020775213 /DNA_START=170 /DNA_END=1294 /DNA_ORIENTATION=-